MADDADIMDLLRIRQVLGIGTPRVFPLSRVAKKKKRQPYREEEESQEETKDKKSPKSGEGVDIEV